jgi:outer membrane protein assembly factor BamA
MILRALKYLYTFNPKHKGLLKIALTLFIIMASQMFINGQKIWIIKEIDFTGNIRTKTESILRELDIKPGDTIAHHMLNVVLGRNKNRLFNTGLFYHVNASLLPDNENSELAIIWFDFREYSKYAYGFSVDFADRNINIWLQQKQFLLDRLDFTFTGSMNNFDGKNQRIRAKAQFGYTELIGYFHHIPFINREKTLGLSIDVMATRNRELNYDTQQDKQVFRVDPGQFLFWRQSLGISLHYRGEHSWRHIIELRYHHMRIGDLVKDSLNSLFFNGLQRQVFEEFQYHLIHENRDRIIYPLQGSFFEAFLQKRGVFLNKDVDQLFIGAEQHTFFTFKNNWSYHGIAKLRLALQRHFPGYFQHRAMGDRLNTIRGYELFVFEGLDYGYIKQSLRRRIFNGNIRWLAWVPGSRFQKVALEIYSTLNADLGGVNNPFSSEDNIFTNKFLFGGGFGIDFVVMGDMFFRLESSTNQFGLTGIYLHTRFGIH